MTAQLRELRSDGGYQQRRREGFYENAAEFFKSLVRDEGPLTHAEIRRRARLAIEAVCIFQEEWEIAAMEPAQQEPVLYDTGGWPHNDLD